ncbi:hypothetical protein [Anaerofustis stercorihominis]|uniref:Spore coat protein GerQ n=1 Tax=Anaerofustis stercorihominis TaxID=214853 RepID=A0A3E3DUX0_9FIRM|nr:hypothetical protein [Anaerofustis stercorihominis]MCQ4795527.1 hypothetical protein [Anaerofustis stercorihominis]RGD73084.1 hypothetical protein DW687_11540 [Anaerofustis stercorihominis]
MEREDNLNNILNGQMSSSSGLDGKMNSTNTNQTTIMEGDGSNIPPEFTAGTTPSILNTIKGEFCICEFLIGSDTLVSKQGIIYSVGLSYFTLYNVENNEYIICDIYSVKFITLPRGNMRDYMPSSPNNNNSRRNRR